MPALYLLHLPRLFSFTCTACPLGLWLQHALAVPCLCLLSCSRVGLSTLPPSLFSPVHSSSARHTATQPARTPSGTLSRCLPPHTPPPAFCYRAATAFLSSHLLAHTHPCPALLLVWFVAQPLGMWRPFRHHYAFFGFCSIRHIHAFPQHMPHNMKSTATMPHAWDMLCIPASSHSSPLHSLLPPDYPPLPALLNNAHMGTAIFIVSCAIFAFRI